MRGFTLDRIPDPGNAPLRAWDAADEFLADAFDELDLDPAATVLIVGDSFGALSVVLGAWNPTVASNSMTSRAAITANCTANGVAVPPFVDTLPSPEPGTLVPGSSVPGSLVSGTKWAAVLVRVPKSVGELEAALAWLAPQVDKDTTIIGGGMTKLIHTSTSECFETFIGPTSTSLAKKKARLVHPVVDPNLHPPRSQWPAKFRDSGMQIFAEAGVFSATALDHGTYLLQQTLLEDPLDLHMGDMAVDLGCGSGVLGTTLGRQHPNTAVSFVDDFIPAIRSAEQTWRASHGERHADFVATHRFSESFEPDSIEVVVCNPPFHAGGVKTDQVAWEMFSDAKTVLRRGGVLRVVGNRNLGYHAKLNKIFRNVETIATDKRFVVLESVA